MLIREVLLLEYDRQRAIQALGDGLWLAVVKENTMLWDFDKNKLAEFALKNKNSKGDYIRDVLNDPKQQQRFSIMAMDTIEKADPTNNKQYSQWMARMYINGSERKLEDIESTMATYVDKFHKLKIKNKLKDDERDINRFRSAAGFYAAMDQYEDPDENKTGQANKVYEDSDVTVVVPLDQDAACNYGRQTRWCTAAMRGNNLFSEYNRQGPLFILIPKTPRYEREKYQMHFETSQYMNEVDYPVDLPFLLQNRFPQLYEFFKSQPKIAEYLQDMIVFTPDDVLTKLTADIWEHVQSKVYNYINDLESNDDEYINWLHELGHTDQDGMVDWDKAPSYLEYNDAARRWVSDVEEFVRLRPAKLKEVVIELVENGSVNEDTIYDLEVFIAQNLREEMRRDDFGADGIADWIEKYIRVVRTNKGPQVIIN